MNIIHSNHINVSKLFSEECYADTPFPHVVVKDLFSPKLSQYLYSKIEYFLSQEVNIKSLQDEFDITKKKLPAGKIPSITYRNDRWYKLGIDLSLYKTIHAALSPLKDKIFEFYVQSRFSEEYYLDVFFAFTLPQINYEIHDDIKSKCWTLAYFIYPEMSAATKLYNISKQKVYKYDWRINAGIAFCPKDCVTWHSYHNPSIDQVRTALVINIVRKEPYL